MAVTFDGLIEQIEKVATKCGVEDFEFIAGPDWTIPLLKEELSRWKEILKQKTAEKKAVKSIITTAKDFFVKSDKVFKGDAYIIDCIYVLPGPVSKKALVGEVFLQIDDDFIDPIRQVLFHGETHGVWYIPSIAAMKQDMSTAITGGVQYVSKFHPMEDGSAVREELDRLLNETYHDLDDFRTIPKQEDPMIFTRKKIFRLQFPGMRDVLLNIQLLPTVTTEETLEEVEYCMKLDGLTEGKNPVYYLRIRIAFSHYTVNLKYKYT